MTAGGRPDFFTLAAVGRGGEKVLPNGRQFCHHGGARKPVRIYCKEGMSDLMRLKTRLVHTVLVFALSCLVGVFWLASPSQANKLIFKSYSTEGKFEDILDDVRQEITNQGLVIAYHGKLADMLKRTAADVGEEKPIYRNAEFFTFCSAVLSRNAMKRDPQNIAFCPYAVYVYEPYDEPGVIYAGYRKFTTFGPSRSQAALEKINKLLDTIVREATK